VPVDRDGAEGAVDGGVALLVNGGIARADVDRVMAGGATLVDHAALAERQGVMAATGDDLADACDIDPIVAVAYDYCSLAIDGGINIAATRYADAAQWLSPLNRTADCGRLVAAKTSLSLGQARCKNLARTASARRVYELTVLLLLLKCRLST
jgi:hypothetical protein